MIDHHDNDTSGDWMIWFFSLHELLHTWLANLQRLYMFSDYGYKVNFVIEDTMSGSLWQASIVCICLHYILASMTDKFKRCMNEYPKLAQVSSPERHYKLYLLNSENIMVLCIWQSYLPVTRGSGHDRASMDGWILLRRSGSSRVCESSADKINILNMIHT